MEGLATRYKVFPLSCNYLVLLHNHSEPKGRSACGFVHKGVLSSISRRKCCEVELLGVIFSRGCSLVLLRKRQHRKDAVKGCS